MDTIIEKIYEKMHEFGMKHFRESPTMLILNHEHYYEIIKIKNYFDYVKIDSVNGCPKAIMGMEYQIKDDIKEMIVE